MTDPDPPLDPDGARVAALHVALRQWLAATYPHEDGRTIAAALTYEVGRIVGLSSEQLDDAAIDRLLDGVRADLRAHVQCWRAGLHD